MILLFYESTVAHFKFDPIIRVFLFYSRDILFPGDDIRPWDPFLGRPDATQNQKGQFRRTLMAESYLNQGFCGCIEFLSPERAMFQYTWRAWMDSTPPRLFSLCQSVPGVNPGIYPGPHIKFLAYKQVDMRREQETDASAG